MRKDKEKAVELRRQNKSYREINRILGVPKSTLAEWFKNDKRSTRIKALLNEKNLKESSKRIRNVIKANKAKWSLYYKEAQQEARGEFHTLRTNPLFTAGLMLYWGEGDNKGRSAIRITNTDHRMISLYVRFLEKILKIDKSKLRVGLILYPDLEVKRCMDFWSRATGIPLSQFHKPQFIKGHHPTTRLLNGICMVNFSNSYLKEKVLTWIDLLSQTL